MVRIVVLLLGIVLSCGAAVAQDDALPSVAIVSSHQAYARALEYLGFEYIKKSPLANAESTVHIDYRTDDQTPFFHDKINGHPVWEIIFDSVYLDLPDWPGTRGKGNKPRTYHVLIDSSSGQLLRVYSRLNQFDPDLAPEPPAERAEAYMTNGRERFLGAPDAIPPIAFFHAMNGAIASYPHGAKEIEAMLYLTVVAKDSIVPVWSIIGRGIPPDAIGRMGAKGPLYISGRMRTVVDATTGKTQFITIGPLIEKDTLFDRLWLERQKRLSKDSTR